MTTGFAYDERFLKHDTGSGHPERADRLRSAMSSLSQQAWYDQLQTCTPRIPEREWLETIHTGQYVSRVEREIESGASFVDSPDVAVSDKSFDAALLATGAALELADGVMSKKIDNGFALVRPPGHHAEASTALGFCLLNSVAITARYLQRFHGVDKVLILDWDVHHGNGTQHSFEDDPSVLFVSTHQYPHYPGTGAASEDGVGRGQGATLNCPMGAGSTDADYEQVWRETILPKIDSFAPEVVLLSAGFDAHAADPLSSINLSTEFFGWMSQRMLEVADRHAGGRLVSLLEGGYDLNALAECVDLHVAHLAGVAKIEQ